MNNPEIEKILAPLRKAVKEQGDLVRSLKQDEAPEVDILKAVAELKIRKKALEDKELFYAKPLQAFDRMKFDDLLEQRFFYSLSFSIYGGIAGLYDLGPMGCKVKSNLLSLWKEHFVIEEQMMEVECSILTPEPVLVASGHVERFADYMVKDLQTGDCHRLDHLIKGHLEKLLQKATPEEKTEYEDILIKLDGMSKEEMNALVKRFEIKSPTTGNDVSEAVEFNLMFGTQIGPTGRIPAFLRPETAQGIFTNFKKLLNANQGRLPFAAAQIGKAFRNEISPRAGLNRVREFEMAEIEHFVDPQSKDHPKFEKVANLSVVFYSACNQMDGKSAESMTIGEAVAKKIVANQTLGYFLGRIYQFLTKAGVDPMRIRFRQHMSNEMAHYACDCWDAEVHTSYGWTECVGCADRSCFDLSQHSTASGVRLVAEKKLDSPREVQVRKAMPNKAVLGKAFRANSKEIVTALESLSSEKIDLLERELAGRGVFELGTPSGQTFTITPDMVSISTVTKKVFVEEFTPGVIEPSFGINRIMYAILEHSFRVREGDEQRAFLSLSPLIAPIKCSILPLSNHPDFKPFVDQLCQTLTKYKIIYKNDESSTSIGRRYARTDEIGIPFGVTVDFDTLKAPHSVTIRERNTMDQIRVPIEDVGGLIRDLSQEVLLWAEVTARYPKFEQQEATMNTASS